MDAIPDEPSLQCQCTLVDRVVERVSAFLLRGHNLASPFLVALDLMGTFVFALSGVGGGVLRDMLVNETSVVLKADIYAVAALAASIVVVSGHVLCLPSFAMMMTGAALCFCLRLLAIFRGWHLPTARLPH
jgi:uncharacterized membrane protein YeiH